jgi:drug/metabolite transporter (DMT)-like permease
MGLAVTELLTVLLYLWSLKFLFVSYAVAAKRTGILLSVVSGWLFFGEQIRDKIVHILIMVAGMLLIVLAPDLRYNMHLRHP